MSFLDTSPDLASDLHDAFNMLYPPSPDSTVSDDWRDGDDSVTSTGALANTSTEVVDLDEPVNGLAPLDVHEQRSLTAHEGHPTQGERHSRIELLLDKLSRKRIRALLDSTLPLIGQAVPAVDGTSTKKRKLIQLIEPDIEIPKSMQVRQTVSDWRRHGGNLKPGSVKRDRQRSPSANTPSIPEYSPFSVVSYRSRLCTFTLPTYPTKPSSLLSPQACAQAGWINQGGKDRLVCEVCRKAWRVEFPSKEMTGGITLSTEMRTKYMQLLAKQLVLAHTPSCPWRIRQCPSTIHQDLLLLNPPISSHLAPLAFDVESNILARGETPSVAHFEEADIELVSPLDATQIHTLTDNLNQALETDLVTEALDTHGENDVAKVLSRRNHASSSTPISSTAAILAFFGWNVYRPQDLGGDSKGDTTTARNGPTDVTIVPDVLRCRICDRKLGLWAFRHIRHSSQTALPKAVPKPLDVIREHREFCPIRTLAAGTAIKPSQPWWADAAILQESIGTGMTSEEAVSIPSLGNAEVHGSQNRQGGMQETNKAVENVVPKLKDFTRVDIL